MNSEVGIERDEWRWGMVRDEWGGMRVRDEKRGFRYEKQGVRSKKCG